MLSSSSTPPEMEEEEMGKKERKDLGISFPFPIFWVVKKWGNPPTPQEDRWGDSGEIQCRSNFLFTRGIRAVRGDHYGSSLLENLYIPYQYMDSYLSSTGLGLASMEKEKWS
ncbi:hypothetical protein Lal_00039837 [Lupinus albus]|nr:hypothetical protein Lal_00039837 [Lupinus albus]